MKDIYYPSRDRRTTIHACIWQPEGEVKGVVQIIHGMAEYAARYAPFAEFLASTDILSARTTISDTGSPLNPKRIWAGSMRRRGRIS